MLKLQNPNQFIKTIQNSRISRFKTRLLAKKTLTITNHSTLAYKRAQK